MRIVALVIGFAAAALALGLPTVTGTGVVSGIGPMIAALTGVKGLALYALYVPAGLAILGGLIVLASPASGAILLLISALVWFGMASLKPEFFSLELLAPSGVALFAAIIAFVGGEMGNRRDLRQRDNRLMTREGYAARGRVYREPDFLPPDEEPDMDRDPAIPPFGEPELEPATTAARLSSRRNAPARMSGPRQTRRARYVEDDLPRRRAGNPALILFVLLLVLGGGAVYAALGPLKLVATGTVAGPAEAPAPPPPAEGTVSAAKETAAAESRPLEGKGPGGTFLDPRVYCKAVNTIDRPDARYTGEPFSQMMAARLKIPVETSPDRVRWRCLEGQVLVCSSFAGPVCDQTPTLAEMQEFCRIHPDVRTLFAPAGIWACVEGKPQLPDDAKWPVDARGFFPPAWMALTRASDAPKPDAGTPAPVPGAADLLATPAAADPAATDPAVTGSTTPALPAGDGTPTDGTTEGPIDPAKTAPVPATRPAGGDQPLSLGG